MSISRQPYPSDVTDDEWAFVAPYLTLMSEDALQRRYDLREVFNGVRWLVRTGAPWRMLPHDFPAGRRSTSRRSAGCARAALKRSSTICGCSCACALGVTGSRRR